MLLFVFVFIAFKYNWIQLNTINSIKGRKYAGMVYYNDAIYVFCGYNGYYLGDMYCLNLKLDTLYWKEIVIKKLPRMFGFTSHMYNDNIVIFGGKYGLINYSRDLYILNIDSNDIRKVSVNYNGIRFKKRAHHSSTVIGNKLYIYGGYNSGVLNDTNLYYINLENNKLHLIDTCMNPVSRHLMLSYQNNIYFIGGNDEDNDKFSGVVCSTITKNRQKITNIVSLPFGLSCLNGCIINNIIYLFGGKYRYDSASNKTLFYEIQREIKEKHDNIDGETHFKQWFLEEFPEYSNIYDKIKKTCYDDICLFVELKDHDLNTFGLERIKQKIFKNKIKKIRKQYYNFKEYFYYKKMNKYHYKFILNGIYYWDIFDSIFTCIKDLNIFLKNKRAAIKIFNTKPLYISLKINDI